MLGSRQSLRRMLHSLASLGTDALHSSKQAIRPKLSTFSAVDAITSTRQKHFFPACNGSPMVRWSLGSAWSTEARCGRCSFAAAVVRSYKVISPAVFEIPKRVLVLGRKNTMFDNMAYTEASNSLTRSLHEARMPENWRRHKFYVKPKCRRAGKKWAGILKRKRRDFNYKLRWALKSMTRGL
jgi:ribosomal protein S21